MAPTTFDSRSIGLLHPMLKNYIWQLKVQVSRWASFLSYNIDFLPDINVLPPMQTTAQRKDNHCKAHMKKKTS